MLPQNDQKNPDQNSRTNISRLLNGNFFAESHCAVNGKLRSTPHITDSNPFDDLAVWVGPNSPREIDIQLYAGHTLHGVVRDAITSLPLPG